MSKQFHSYACTGRHCEEDCGIVMIVREVGAQAGTNRPASNATLILDRTLHKDCGRCLVPASSKEFPA